MCCAPASRPRSACALPTARACWCRRAVRCSWSPCWCWAVPLPAVVLRVQQGGAENQVVPNPQRPPKYEVRTPKLNLGVRGTEFRVQVDGDRQWVAVDYRPCACHRRGGRPRARRGLGGRRRRPACAAAARARRGRRAARRRAPAAAPQLGARHRQRLARPDLCAAGLQSPAARCASQAARSHLARDQACPMATTRCACAPSMPPAWRARPPMWISACRRGPSRPSSACRRLTPWSTPRAWSWAGRSMPRPRACACRLRGTPHSRTWSSSPHHRRREPRRQPAAGRLPLAHCFGGRRARRAFGDAQRFELREPPPAPPPATPAVNGNQLDLRWPAVSGVVGWRTEWATNAGFEGAVTHKTDKPELTLPKPAPGRYFACAPAAAMPTASTALGQTQLIDQPEEPLRWPWLILVPVVPRAALSFAAALDAQRAWRRLPWLALPAGLLPGRCWPHWAGRSA